MNRKALFVCYGGGHAKMLIPVVKVIQSDASFPMDAVVLAATTAGPEFDRAGIPRLGYRDLLRSGDDRALALGRTLLTDSHDPTSGIADTESVAYLGLSYADLIDRVGPDEASTLYARYGRHAFLQLGPMGRAIDLLDPAIVITTNSPKSERAALVVAAERGIASLYLEDLLGALPGAHPRFVPPPRADRYCVGSRIAAEALMRRLRLNPSAVRLTGNPAFDRLAHLDASARDRVRSQLGIPLDTNGMIVYMDPGATPPVKVGEMAAAVHRISGARFVVRRHPNDRRISVDDYLRSVGTQVVLSDHVDLDGLLMASDAIITVASTTAVEALLVGRPVVQLGTGTGIPSQTHDSPEDLPLYRYGAAILVDRIESLDEVIPALLHGPIGRSVRERVSELFAKPGKAALAVADEIRALAV